MFLDALSQFDPANTAITVSAASTNVLDMTVGRDMGLADRELGVLAVVQQAFTAAGAATLQISMQGAADNGGVPGTWYDYLMTGPLAKANLTLGQVALQAPLPLHQPAATGSLTPPRFYRLNYTVATGPFTAGQIEAALVPARALGASTRYYPANFSASN